MWEGDVAGELGLLDIQAVAPLRIEATRLTGLVPEVFAATLLLLLVGLIMMLFLVLLLARPSTACPSG